MNKISNKNKILRGIKAMILVAVIVLSTAAVTTATSISSTSVNIEKKAESSMETLSDVLLQEGFEDGVMPPPGGWEKIDGTQTNYHWEIIDADTEPGLVHTGEYAALVNFDYLHNQNEWLISPEVDLTGNYETVTLSFWANSTWYTQTGNVYVKVFVNNQDITVWDMINDEPDWQNVQIYREVILDLSDFIGNVVRIKWHYEDKLYAPFALDDIIVYAGEPPDPPELEIGEITGGWAGFGKGGKVSAEVKNVGLGNATDVEWSISATGNGILQKINESDNGTISMLAPDDVETVELVAGHHFGKINVTVTAYEPYFDIFVSKSVDAFIIISFVIIPS